MYISRQRINIRLISQTTFYFNEGVYLTKKNLIYVIYFVLNLSIQTYILHEETIILANQAQNKLNLT